jgi:hypothetical protein
MCLPLNSHHWTDRRLKIGAHFENLMAVAWRGPSLRIGRFWVGTHLFSPVRVRVRARVEKKKSPIWIVLCVCIRNRRVFRRKIGSPLYVERTGLDWIGLGGVSQSIIDHPKVTTG